MKKLFYLCILLSVFYFIGCNKTPKGKYIIENQSSYTINVGAGQNYQVKNYEINSGESIGIDWTVYFSHYLNSPSLNLIQEIKETGKSIYIDKSPANKYRIINNLPKSVTVGGKTINLSLRLLDNEKIILSDNGIYAQFIDINNSKPYADIMTFKRINKEDVFITCVDENKDEARFNFKPAGGAETKTYKIIEKTDSGFYFQEISADKKTVLISKIDIQTADIKSQYTDSEGNIQAEIIPAIIINKN